MLDRSHRTRYPTFEGFLANQGVLMGHVCADDSFRRTAAEDLRTLMDAELSR